MSNVDGATLDAWLEAADRVGLPDPRLVENEYSLLNNRADEADVLPTCRELDVEHLAYSPLAGGVLTGKYQRGEPPPPPAPCSTCRPRAPRHVMTTCTRSWPASNG